mmetsp:Transcript_37615/g.100301  ORF Transcript_37615/g.100301 Transcript_37615/m.100301 type:complete len:244 (-) Transcript_37615:308-1039(-)
MVPEVFRSLVWHRASAQVDVRIAPGDEAVLGHRVQTPVRHRAQELRPRPDLVTVSVRELKGLAHHGLCRSAGSDLQTAAGLAPGSGCPRGRIAAAPPQAVSQLDRARPVAEAREDPALTLSPARDVAAGPRQVRTSDDAEHRAAALHEPQADGVLRVTDKALGAVDRVQDPESTFAASGVAAALQQGDDIRLREAPTWHTRSSVQACSLGEGEVLVKQGNNLLQLSIPAAILQQVCILLPHQT